MTKLRKNLTLILILFLLVRFEFVSSARSIEPLGRTKFDNNGLPLDRPRFSSLEIQELTGSLTDDFFASAYQGTVEPLNIYNNDIVSIGGIIQPQKHFPQYNSFQSVLLEDPLKTLSDSKVPPFAQSGHFLGIPLASQQSESNSTISFPNADVNSAVALELLQNQRNDESIDYHLTKRVKNNPSLAQAGVDFDFSVAFITTPEPCITPSDVFTNEKFVHRMPWK